MPLLLLAGMRRLTPSPPPALADYVMEDFLGYVNRGLGNASAVAGEAVAALGGAAASAACYNSSYVPCAEVVAAFASRTPVTLTLHNSLGWLRSEVVEVLVPSPNVALAEEGGGAVVGQVSPANPADVEAPGSWWTVAFLPPSPLPPLGWRTYTLTPVDAGSPAALPVVSPATPSGPFTLTNGLASLSFSANGTLVAVAAPQSGIGNVSAFARGMWYSSKGGK